MLFILRCVLLTLVIIVNVSFDSSDGWVMKKNSNGIVVYTRPHPGSGLKDVRVVNTVNSSLSAIVALLMDTKNFPNWVYDCKEGRTLKSISEKEQMHYMVTSLPSPLSDRDIVAHFKISQDATTKTVTTNSTGTPTYLPVKQGIVRVEQFQSGYKLTPLPGGKVRIQFELFVDPGGSIPNALINALIIKGPFNSTLSMINELNKKQYQMATVPFISELKK